MSLATQVQNLATRVSTECKSIRTLVNGNAGGLSALTTTEKTTIVGAINELVTDITTLEGQIASASGINDTSESSTTETWSINKIKAELAEVVDMLADYAPLSHTHAQSDITGLSTALAGKLGTSHEGTGGTAHANVVAAGAAGFMTGADKTKLDGIAAGATANATDAQLRDRSTHTGTQAISTVTGLQTALDAKAVVNDAATNSTNTWSSTKISTEIGAATAALVDSSPATLDTLNELAAALGDDPNFATTTSTALGSRLRFDAAQTLTSGQKTQGLTNLGAVAAADVGNTDTDFVATFEAGLL